MRWTGGSIHGQQFCYTSPSNLRDLDDGKWHAGVEAKAAAKAGNVGAAASGNTTDLLKKSFSTYVLTDAGVSCGRDGVTGATLFHRIA